MVWRSRRAVQHARSATKPGLIKAEGRMKISVRSTGAQEENKLLMPKDDLGKQMSMLKLLMPTRIIKSYGRNVSNTNG